MFPDPITPKSFPEILESVDYDPFNVMPRAFPARPHVLITPRQMEITRRLVAKGGWPRLALQNLLAKAAADPSLPAAIPIHGDSPLAYTAVRHALNNAWAALYLNESRHRSAALRSLRWLARAYTAWPVQPGRGRLGVQDIDEAHFILNMAHAYDLLAARPLSAADDRLFRRMLEATRTAADTAAHGACGNHHTGALLGRLAAAVALHDRQGMHDALYGCRRDGKWCYGIIHQLRHDFLDDGMQWERTAGYHGSTLSMIAYIADLLLPLGIDLWNLPLPPLWQNDGQDLHRDYGSRPGAKTIKAAFDAPFYYTLTNGDLSTLGDSRLENLRGMMVWGIFYHRAYDVYGDPKYAWLINRAEADCAQAPRARPGMPMCLQSPWLPETEFARLGRSANPPPGKFDLGRDAIFALNGAHRHGCSLFASTGAALLRGNAADAGGAAAAFIFWGPHAAGHQSPAALHIDLSGAGRKLTDAPRMDNRGYGDPLYLTWARTTIAHNTVTVDGAPMFPYDFETNAIWECDHWRDTISDGELLLFQPEHPDFKAVRAINERVYPGVRLDRTVIVTANAVLDLFRVTADRVRQFDWAMHVAGAPALPPGCRRANLGQARGYRHFSNIRRLPHIGQTAAITWQRSGSDTHGSFVVPAGAQLFMARDPIPDADKMHTIGEIAPVPPRHAIIIRAKAREALFLSAWSFGKVPLPLKLKRGTAVSDITVTLGRGKTAATWHIPHSNQPIAVTAQDI